MGKLVNYVTPLHQATSRAYIDRMVDDKVHCMLKAKEYEADYWDGDRRYGYGGYKYMPGRWKPVAEALIENYNLTNESSVLDVGCGKAYLLYEMKLLLPELRVVGFDISKHGLADAKEEIKDARFIHRAQDPYPFEDNEFDLVISLGCFHNLRIFGYGLNWGSYPTRLSCLQKHDFRGPLTYLSYVNETLSVLSG